MEDCSKFFWPSQKNFTLLRLGGFKLMIPHSRVASTLQILLVYVNFYVKFAKLRTIWKRLWSRVDNLKPPNWHTTTIQSPRSLKRFLRTVGFQKIRFFYNCLKSRKILKNFMQQIKIICYSLSGKHLDDLDTVHNVVKYFLKQCNSLWFL